jgi:hypothetical protein
VVRRGLKVGALAVVAALAFWAFMAFVAWRLPPPGVSRDVVTGVVISVSDVAGEPDTPYGPARILVVPERQAEALWRAGDRELVDDDFLPEAALRLPVDVALSFEGVLMAEVARSGRFRFEIDPARHLICFDSSEGTIVNARGCGLEQLEGGEHLDVWISDVSVYVEVRSRFW